MKIRGAKIKGAKFKGARILMGVNLIELIMTEHKKIRLRYSGVLLFLHLLIRELTKTLKLISVFFYVD